MSIRLRRIIHLSTLVIVASGLSACASAGSTPGPPSHLSPGAVAGWEIAGEKGCMSCHGAQWSGADGSEAVGPSWEGLAGSVRTLVDGSEVIADREYLELAVREPNAQRVAGYTIKMPEARLTDAEVEAIVDYLEEVS